jgi:cytochrome c oxidase assembly protein subunit 11
MTHSDITRANRRLVPKLLLFSIAMFGFGYLLVPLYDVICDITGLNGKTASSAVAMEGAANGFDTSRTITVEFVSSLNSGAPWEFRPAVTRMQVHPGEFYEMSYVATNLTDQAMVGQAVPSVAPGPAAVHFQKIECFCFDRQDFAPGESKDMPVMFRIDPRLAEHVNVVTLSYTFFKLDPSS